MAFGEHWYFFNSHFFGLSLLKRRRFQPCGVKNSFPAPSPIRRPPAV